MKALILYDKIASALKVSNLLQTVRTEKNIHIDWEINLWHTGILRFPSVADAALKRGADADMMVFAGCRANLLRPWTIQWLERWVSSRLIEHAVLVLVDGQFTDVCPLMNEFELSRFARRHDIAYVACGNVIDEMGQHRRRKQILPGRESRAIAEHSELAFA